MNASEADVNGVTESIMRLVSRQVWVVTSGSTMGRGGLLATWVNQASIDSENPLMLIGIAPNHHTNEIIDHSGRFALHLLCKTQIATAFNFANGSGRDRDKFASMSLMDGHGEHPILQECHSWLKCDVTSRLLTGDRTYYWGQVTDAGQNSSESPLLDSEFISGCDPTQLKVLRADRFADVELQRPLNEAFQADLPDWLRP